MRRFSPFNATAVAGALLLSACAAAAAAPLPPGAPSDIRFAGGVATGVAAAAPANVSYWLGVPFAASTDGDNAFRAPQPRAPWAGKLNATAFAPGCLQPHHNPDVPPTQSFDCLSLNVYMPGTTVPAAGATPFAVMVFFNGGAFLEGSDEGPFGTAARASLPPSASLSLRRTTASRPSAGSAGSLNLISRATSASQIRLPRCSGCVRTRRPSAAMPRA